MKSNQIKVEAFKDSVKLESNKQSVRFAPKIPPKKDQILIASNEAGSSDVKLSKPDMYVYAIMILYM